MIGSVRITGAGAVQTRLTNIAQKVPAHAARTMQRAAQRIVKTAKLMVPEDTGALMDSIRIERGVQSNRRIYINVVVGNEIVILPNGRAIDLNDYALIIHENYDDMNPGAKTIEKQALNPDIKVGSGFMTRAAEAEKPVLEASMIKGIEQIILGGTGE